jgi:hypothetical protein
MFLRPVFSVACLPSLAYVVIRGLMLILSIESLRASSIQRIDTGYLSKMKVCGMSLV